MSILMHDNGKGCRSRGNSLCEVTACITVDYEHYIPNTIQDIYYYDTETTDSFIDNLYITLELELHPKHLIV